MNLSSVKGSSQLHSYLQPHVHANTWEWWARQLAPRILTGLNQQAGSGRGAVAASLVLPHPLQIPGLLTGLWMYSDVSLRPGPGPGEVSGTAFRIWLIQLLGLCNCLCFAPHHPRSSSWSLHLFSREYPHMSSIWHNSPDKVHTKFCLPDCTL